MARTTGVGDRLYLAGTDVSGDASTVELASPLGVVDTTDMTQNAYARSGGGQSGVLHFVAFHNPTRAHPVLAALPTSQVILTYLNGGLAGSHGAGMVGRQVGYDPQRGGEGSLLFGVHALSDGTGLEWGREYVGGATRTDTAATNGAGIDDDAPSSAGFTAYLHAFTFTGTSVTVALQHSSDNGVGDPWTALLTFPAVTAAPGAQRVTVTGVVKRWLRTVTTGVFTSFVFHVLGIRIAEVDVAVDVQRFLVSGNWVKPLAGQSVAFVFCLGGGGGGGRGLANNAAVTGGSAGGGAAYSSQVIPFTALAASETVTVGAGGAGAPLGGSANPGDASFFGTVRKVGSQAGNAGLNASNSLRLGGAGGLGEQAGIAGGDGNLSAAGSNGATSFTFAACGGGGGGGKDAAQNPFGGGLGGASFQSALLGSGAAGTVPSGPGGDATGATPNTPSGGQGGGGGAAGGAGQGGGNGGAGGIYGGGGGGGGSCPAGQTPGTGGAGAPGIVIVISW